MGRPLVAELRCFHCRQTSSVQCLELEEACAMLDGLRKLLIQSNLAFFEVDTAGCVTQWNARTAEVLGVADVDAFGQPLADLVSEKHRVRVTQTIMRAQKGDARLCSLRLGAREGTPATGMETLFNLSALYDSAGWLRGVVGLAEPDVVAKKPREGTTLPAPVGGVMAWRCILHSSADLPAMFEISRPKVTPGEVQADALGNTFCEMVEKAVRTAAADCIIGDGLPTPFECEVVPFETEDGTTQYFSIRGVSTNGPEMPFGDSISLAQGYVINITALRLAIQESENWQERWRALAQLAYSFMLLVDITEYRVVKSWDAQPVFDESLDGRSLFDFVTAGDQAAAVNSFSAALLTPAGICRQPFFFCHRATKQRIVTECAMVSDASDPSVIFLGATLVPATAPNPAKQAGSDSSSTLVDAHLLLECNTRSADAALPSDDLHNVGRQGQKKRSQPTATTTSGIRLTAAALGLVSAPLPPPGLTRKSETPPMSKAEPTVEDRGQFLRSGACANGSAVPLRLPPGRPPAPHSVDRGAGGPQAPRSQASAPRHPPASPRQSESPHPPRVFPTQLVLNSDSGSELWSSPVQLLGEHMRAADLLTRDGLQLFSMPDELAETVCSNTHVLFVMESTTNELLQVANVTGTNLQSLQRHCGSKGKLTIVIAPVEDSEDAFETIPGPSK